MKIVDEESRTSMTPDGAGRSRDEREWDEWYEWYGERGEWDEWDEDDLGAWTKPNFWKKMRTWGGVYDGD